MKFEMTHEFAYPAETVWEMMHDPDSHVAKFERMGHTDMEVLSSEVTDTSLDLVLRRQVEMEIPSVAKKFLSPSNTVTSNDHWEDRGDGTSKSSQAAGASTKPPAGATRSAGPARPATGTPSASSA